MILILGGTFEGRTLAEALDSRGVAFILSLAGRTDDPLVAGRVRTGGFGGPEGLAAFLRAEHVGVVVDATHPFATTMSANAVSACREAGVRLIRLERPGWADEPSAREWHWVDDHAQAASTVASLGRRRILLTVGRQHTLDYSPALDDRFVLARVAVPPEGELPIGWRLLISRGPFALDDERRIFADEAIDCLVTKDSGGAHTSAKLTAAAEAGAAVVVVRRGVTDGPLEQVASVEEALSLLLAG